MTYDAVEPKDIFTCEKCGDCCKGYGGTFVTEGDIKRIAEYIKTDSSRFVEQYCCVSGGGPVLAQNSSGYCVFWDEICTIHHVKPRMCRAWPFIRSVLVDIDNWYVMADSCPGIRTDVPDEIIKKCVKMSL